MRMSNKLGIVGLMGAAMFAGCSSAPAPLTQGQIAAENMADPDMGQILYVYDELNPQPLDKLSAQQARQQPTLFDAQTKFLKDEGRKQPVIEVGGVDHRTIPGGDKQDLGLMIYSPKGTGPFPVIVYFHGGGWVLGTPQTYDASERELCSMTNAIVVSVDYRRAPEDKFPAAHHDCYAATQWVLQNANLIHGDPRRVAVAGESAGGNIAAAVCLMCKDQHAPMPIAQLLIYPVAQYGTNDRYPSYSQFAEARPLDAASMKWFFQQYLPTPDRGYDRYIDLDNVPTADLTGLPNATVITAQIDPLMSEGEIYSQHLQAAGVDTKYMNYTGVTHDFFSLSPTVHKAAEAEQFAADRLTAAFASMH
jgi:acetyl esterase